MYCKLAWGEFFAGSGALGIEALSRGAAHCTFVEKNRETMKTIERNLVALQAPCESYVLISEDVTKLDWNKKNLEPLDILFIDPPYALTPTEELWSRCAMALKHDGWMVFEGAKKILGNTQSSSLFGDKKDGSTQWVLQTEKTYGDTVVWVVRCVKQI